MALEDASSPNVGALQALQNVVTAINAQTQVIKANQVVTFPVAVGLGGTGVAVRGATSQSVPAGQSTSSVTPVMAGFAGSITPKTTGTIVIIVSCLLANATPGNGSHLQIRYGTGAAPVNGAAATGTGVGAAPNATNGTANAVYVALNAVVTSLAVGSSYWLDLSIDSPGATLASLSAVSISAFELTV